MLQPKAKQQLFDKLFNMFGDMSKKEIKEFFLDDRAIKYFNGIVKVNVEENQKELIENCYLSQQQSDENSIFDLCYCIIVEEIPKINADALYFIKEFYNRKQLHNLNIMQINKLINDCEQPFVLLKLSTFDSDVNSSKAQENLVDIFKKHGIIINIVRCAWNHSFTINNFESKLNDNN